MPARPAPPRHPRPWPGDRGGHLWPKDREAVAADGTRIRYTVRGSGPGPWVVLCSGYLCPDNFWRGLGGGLMERHPVIVLNYRSVGASGHPRSPGWRTRRLAVDDYAIPRLAQDVAAVLDAEQVDDVVAVGHSMGVQVALQLWRDRPARVRGLVLVTGPYASPLSTFYGSSLGARLFPLARHGLPLLPRPTQRLLLQAVRTPVAMPAARLAKALGPDAPAEDMEEFFAHLRGIDPMIGLKVAAAMHRFDAGPWLPEVDVPAQIVVGTRDTFSPPRLGEQLLMALPDAELVAVEGGTHGALIEFPDEIHDAVADFLARRLAGPDWRPRGRRPVVSRPRRRPGGARGA